MKILYKITLETSDFILTRIKIKEKFKNMALSIKRVTSLVAVSLAALSDSVLADQVQHPLRMMFNSDVLRTLFHKGDQRMLDAFKELKLTLDEPNENCPAFT